MNAATGHGPTHLVPPAAIWDGAEGDQTSGFEDELRHIEGNIPGRWEYPDVGVVAQDARTAMARYGVWPTQTQYNWC
jgi:hypothetical protein